MARFYGEMQGSRGPTTRTGTKKSGMAAHIRGWDVGVRVFIEVDEKGNDVVHVYRTSGSNRTWPDVLVTTFTEAGK